MFEMYFELYDGWFEVCVYFLLLGLLVYFCDVMMWKCYLQVFELINQCFEMVLQNFLVIFLVFDVEGVFIMFEGVGLELFGCEFGEVVGCFVFDFYDDIFVVIDVIVCGLLGEVVDICIEYCGVVYDVWYWFVFDDGEVLKFFGVVIDVINCVWFEDGFWIL